ncbi:hypothetical protein J437_LFUL006595 [Ladona fulva]|uniref:RRM domain-containing protein n=1 Tax=Ladona fulva TaxID=123851 RepID=A0A8K0KM49_LADFU|nr:hypothetical protein J437_LFUL006595 [Ladona fulva]
MSYGRNECRIYVGNLPPDIRTKDIQDLFYKFGKVTFVDLKNRRGPPFAFVEFEDPRDAEDAVHARDGYDYDGYRLRVEFPRGGGPGGFRGRGRGRGPPARRSQYRVLVTGLPPSGSWQDLKDHMREAGDVCFADVFKDGTGVVEFLRYEDMKYAVSRGKLVTFLVRSGTLDLFQDLTSVIFLPKSFLMREVRYFLQFHAATGKKRNSEIAEILIAYYDAL